MLAGCAAAARPKPRLIGLAVILVCAAAVTVCLGFLTGAVLGWAGSGFASVAMIFVSGARFCLRGFTSAAASLTSLLGATAGTGSGFASSGALLAICGGSGFGAGFTSDGGVSTFGSAAIAGLFSGAGGACTSAGEGFNSTGGVSTFAAGSDFSSGSPMAIGDGSGCGAGFDCAAASRPSASLPSPERARAPTARAQRWVPRPPETRRWCFPAERRGGQDRSDDRRYAVRLALRRSGIGRLAPPAQPPPRATASSRAAELKRVQGSLQGDWYRR